MGRILSGMRVTNVLRKCGKGVWSFGERGDFKLNIGNKENLNEYKGKENSTLVFLHGIGADKDMWVAIIKNIPLNYHCIMVDMPGHGDTDFVEGFDQANINSFVTSIREFLEITGLDKSKITLIGYLNLILKLDFSYCE